MINLYAVKDRLIEKYQIFNFCANDAVAQRDFIDWCNKSPFNHAEDYSLFRIGQFNEDDGVFTPDNVFLMKGMKTNEV